MAIVPFPRDMLAGIRWQQDGGRPQVQRSAFTGRATQLDFGTAARWQASCQPVPMWDDEQRAQFAGFESACQVPGNYFRLPAVEALQGLTANNLITDGDPSASATGWTLPSGVGLQRLGWPFPVEHAFRCFSGAARFIRANGEVAVSFAAGQRIFLRGYAISTNSANSALLVVQWLNSSAIEVGTASLLMNPAAGTGVTYRSSAVAPTGTVSALFGIYIPNFASDYIDVASLRASLVPDVATVSGGSNAGRTLALTGLWAGQRNLQAGDLITVSLPGGDEQLIRLAADLVADGSGNATASLATPLRRTPADGAVVELAEPWALMRATHTPGWSVDSQNIYGHTLEAEEAF